MRTLKTSFVLTCACLMGVSYVATTARADGADEPAERLLALGDSIAFGYDPTASFADENNFTGYPEKYKTEEAGNYAVWNASCPGETTGSFISNTAPDNGCRGYRSAYPLHVDYGNSPTQLDFAISELQRADKPVTLVTLNLSANDLFLLQKACAQNPANYQTCFSNGLPAVIGAIAQNLQTILFGIRYQAGYQGRIVFMNLYTVDYTDQSAVTVVGFVNSAAAQVAAAFAVEIADAFTAFANASPTGKACDAGLLIKLPNGTCDVHPSTKGDKVLAQTLHPVP